MKKSKISNVKISSWAFGAAARHQTGLLDAAARPFRRNFSSLKKQLYIKGRHKYDFGRMTTGEAGYNTRFFLG